MERQRRLAGRFRPIDLDDSSARHPPDTERDIKRNRSGRHHFDIDLLDFTEFHDHPLAELLLDLIHDTVDALLLFARFRFCHTVSFHANYLFCLPSL